MHVSVSGPEDGRRMLLLHGGGVAGWMWDPLRAQLEGAHRVIVPDLPGHDRSVDVPYASHAATTAELVRIVRGESDNRPVTVVGFSLGGQLAVLLAAEHPELVGQVVVVSAQAEPLRYPNATLALLSVAAPLARFAWFARAQAKELFIPDAMMAHYLRTSVGITRASLLASVGENVRFAAPIAWSRFPGAALILVGQHERALMKRSARNLQKALKGSILEVVESCGHGIPLQKPEWLAERIQELLR